EAVREAGRVTTGLIDDVTAGGGQDPIDYQANFDGADPQRSNHPVFRTRRVADAHQRRRAHLSVVPDVTPEAYNRWQAYDLGNTVGHYDARVAASWPRTAKLADYA